MKRGFHLVDIADEFRPSDGLSWCWRWIDTASGTTVGVAIVGQHKMLLVLWQTVLPLNTMRVET